MRLSHQVSDPVNPAMRQYSHATFSPVESNNESLFHRQPEGGGGGGEVIGVKAGSPEKVKAKAEAEPAVAADGLPSLCLKQVYPKYNKQFRYLCLVDRIATLFLRFLGIKGNMRLGPTAFRMGLQAFVEAFFQLAGRRSKAPLLRDQVAALLEVCEAHLEGQAGALATAEERRSLSCGRATAPRGSSKTPSSSSTTTTTSSSSSSSSSTATTTANPAPPRRAASHDQRLHRSRSLRTHVEN
ncbi:hypothetical protein CRUP_030006 [Coryphaenoides rupestris]|nr:hypothetical protein CRUP_030006 [Coryphaenoides rupestris]